MTDWQCKAASDLPIDTEMDWDGDAAKQAIWEWAGWDGNKAPSSSGGKTRQAFLLTDMDAPDQKGSYSLPFARPSGGSLKAIASGMRAAASRLPQKDGVDPDEVKKARDVLDGYFSELDKQKAEDEDDRSLSLPMLSRMEIRKTVARDPKDGLPKELLSQVYDADALEDTPLFMFTAAASTGQVDTYNTRMLPSSLKNYAADAQRGLSLQNSHRTDELPLGRTFDGRYVGTQGNGQNRAEFDIFMPHGLTLNSVATDDVIRGIRLGVIRDVSVGFYGGSVRCSICGKDMMTDLWSLLFGGGYSDDESVDPDVPCWHMPGLEYASRNKRGDPTGEREVAVGEIDDAHCAELSLVFDGATPGAGIINGRRCLTLVKAERMAHMGVLTRQDASAVLSRFRSVRSHSIENVLKQRFPGFSIETRQQQTPPPPGLAVRDNTTAIRELPGVHIEPITGTLMEARGWDHEAIARATTEGVMTALTHARRASDADDRCDSCGLPYMGRSLFGPLCGDCRKQGASDGAPVVEANASTTVVAPEPSSETRSTEPAGEATSTQPTPPSTAEEATMANPPGGTGSPTETQAQEDAERATIASQTIEAVPDEHRRAPANPPTGPSGADRLAAPTDPSAARPSGPSTVEHIRQALRQAELVPEDWQGDPVERIRALGHEVRGLRSWATIGESARAELVQTVEAEGVRAYGPEGLPAVVYGRLLETGSWEELTGLREHLRLVAKKNFPGGRVTVEEREQPVETEPAPEPVEDVITEVAGVPDSVYRARY